MFRALFYLTLTLPSFAEHGATAAWLKKMQANYEQIRNLVPNTKLPHRWTQDKTSFLFKAKLDGSQKSYQLNLESGEIKEAPFASDEQNSIEPKHFGTKSEPLVKITHRDRSPDKNWQVELGKQATLTNLKTQTSKNLPPPPAGSQYDSKVRWHSDSSCFYLTHRTKHPKYKVQLIRSSPKDQIQPQHEIHPYDKPGDKLNIPFPTIFFTDDRAPISITPALIQDPYSIKDIHWHPKKHLLSFAFIERGFGKYSLIEINADTRAQNIIVEDSSDKFIYIFGNCYYRHLAKTEETLWLSERSGYNHLHLIKRKNKNVLHPLTSGTWVVRKVEAVDENSRTALIQLSGYYPDQDPYYLHYALLNLDTTKLTLLTESNGAHKLHFSPDKKHYLATWSRVDHPPVYEVRRTSDQKIIATLNKPDLSPLKAIGWQTPERFVTKDRNGKHDIHGIIMRPLNFQKGKKYPVIENIYAGPHGSFVPKSWFGWSSHKSEMAEAGFIVVQIDGLGTNHRGRDFHQIAYQNLKDSGFPDRIKWLKAAAAKYPELDLTRVGIYGGSAGGQSSTAALLHHGDFYKVAVSDCGCHDNRVDKLWWNEQWLDWPLNDSYVQNSNRTHIKNLSGHLLLTVGEMDKNVDPSSTYQIVNDLIEADKDFEFIMVPNGGHGIGEKPHLRRKRIEFFQKHLLHQ